MSDPIAFTYDADTHCPACAIARFGQEPGHFWPPESARDAEGNPVGAIAPWDDWCDEAEPGRHVLACGTCRGVIREHEAAGPATFEPDGANCDCENCRAAVEYADGAEPSSPAELAAWIEQSDPAASRSCSCCDQPLAECRCDGTLPCCRN